MKAISINYTPIQLKLPVDLERIVKINDPVYSFSEVMAHIDLHKYFVEKEHGTGRPRYDREKLLKIVRNASQKGVSWHFTTDDARIKLKHLYPEIKY